MFVGIVVFFSCVCVCVSVTVHGVLALEGPPVAVIGRVSHERCK